QGKVTVHASEHEWIGPKTDSASIPSFGRDPAAQQVTFHYPGLTRMKSNWKMAAW
ncbi:Rhs element Vgr protein, partial [Pseudomonas syringae pv. theae ICMP 3923]